MMLKSPPIRICGDSLLQVQTTSDKKASLNSGQPRNQRARSEIRFHTMLNPGPN